MNWRFIGLSALSLAPWVYIAVATAADLWSRMAGFGFLPFAALLFARTLAFGDAGTDAASDLTSRRSVGSSVALALVLTVAAISVGGWLGDTRGAVRTGAVLLLFLAVGASVAWDIRTAYRRTLPEVPSA